jgi:WD40 repeat protein
LRRGGHREGHLDVLTMPKLKTLQIVWHGKEPVYSLDFHPNGLLVTAGADKEIKTWKVRRVFLVCQLSKDAI